MGRAVQCTCHTLHAMVHEGIAHGTDCGGTRMEGTCCTMINSNHCHRLASSILLQLGSRAPIVIKWPAVVLVIWPHFKGNAQRRPHSASSGLALFSSRICCFLCKSHRCPRGNSNRPRRCPKIWGRIPCFLVGFHWRFFGLLACLSNGQNRSGNYFPTSNGTTPLHNPKGPPLIGATRFCIGMSHQYAKSTQESIDNLLTTSPLDTISAITFLNDVLNPAMLKAASHSTEHSAMHVCLIYLNILVTRANLKPHNGTQKNNMKNTLDKIADKLKLDYRTENWHEGEWTDPNGKVITVRGLTASKLTWELLLNEECKGLSSDDYIASLHNKLNRMKYEPEKEDFGTHYTRFRDALQAFPYKKRLEDKAKTDAFVNTLHAEIKRDCIIKIDTTAKEQNIPKFNAARGAWLAVINQPQCLQDT